MAKIFTIDVSGIESEQVLFERLLKCLDAPHWHGKNLDALWESIGYGQNGLVAPPYEIHFVNVNNLSGNLCDRLFLICKVFDEARVENHQLVHCFAHMFSWRA